MTRYIWTFGGEEVEGETDESLDIAWRPGTRGLPMVGTVTAVYEVFGTDVSGVPVPFSVTFNPNAFVLIVR